MKCTNPGCTGAMKPAGQDYCQCQRCGTTALLRDDVQPTIPPAVREAAVRLREWERLKADNFPTDCRHSYIGDLGKTESQDILLICQHVLGREQG